MEGHISNYTVRMDAWQEQRKWNLLKTLSLTLVFPGLLLEPFWIVNYSLFLAWRREEKKTRLSHVSLLLQGHSNLMMTEEEEVLWIINTFFCVHGIFSHAGIAREKTYREPKPFCLLSPSQNNLILLFSLYSTLSSLLLSSYVSPVCCSLCEKMKCIRVEEWVGFLSAVARSWLSGNARALLLCVWRKSCSFAFSDLVLSPLF